LTIVIVLVVLPIGLVMFFLAGKYNIYPKSVFERVFQLRQVNGLNSFTFKHCSFKNNNSRFHKKLSKINYNLIKKVKFFLIHIFICCG